MEFFEIKSILKSLGEDGKTCLKHISVDKVNNYEYFEFLGDSVMKTALISIFSNFKKKMPLKYIHQLIHMVSSNKVLTEISNDIGLAQLVKVKKDSNKRITWMFKDKQEKIGADVLEALIGAIYTNFGMIYVENFIKVFFAKKIITYLNEPCFDSLDFSTKSSISDFFGKYILKIDNSKFRPLIKGVFIKEIIDGKAYCSFGKNRTSAKNKLVNKLLVEDSRVSKVK